MYDYTNVEGEETRVYEEEDMLEVLNQMYDKEDIIEEQSSRIGYLSGVEHLYKQVKLMVDEKDRIIKERQQQLQDRYSVICNQKKEIKTLKEAVRVLKKCYTEKTGVEVITIADPEFDNNVASHPYDDSWF